MAIERISVVGIGKVGLCMAACFSHKGYEVIGVDVNSDIIEAVNKGRSPIYEPGLAELIRESAGRLSATDDCRYAIENSEITFMMVSTPSEEDGGFSTRYVEATAKNIGANLKSKDNFHVVVLSSTVLPGATLNVVKPLLEKASGKKCGIDFGLCHNPLLIALGSVIRDFTNPDVVLIGESDPKSGEALSEVYQTVCDNDPPILRANIYNVELAKTSLNAYVTMKISFANMLAELCEQIPGGDVDVVSRMLGAISKIGGKGLVGAIGFGGPCFPRDSKAFVSFAEKVGCKAWLAEATDEVNKHQNERIVELVKQKIGDVRGKSIAVLGLTYKPNTDATVASVSIEIAKALSKEGANIRVYDPAGQENAKKTLRQSVKYASSPRECLTGAEFCILATPWDEFKKLKPEDFTENMKEPILLDCWRIFDRSEFSKRLEYLAIGLGPK